MMSRSLLIVLGLVFTGSFSLPVFSQQPIAPQTAGAQLMRSIYISTGDNLWTGNSLPIDTRAAIDASFDLMKNMGVKRIYWRGLEMAVLVENALRRPESPRYYECWKWFEQVYQAIDLDRYAVQAAHKRGMKIWGLGNWAEGFGQADAPPIWDYPFTAESKLRIEHPEWVPVDRYGIMKQAGPIDFSYPEARKAWIDLHMKYLTRDQYDGAMFISYSENNSTRFQDEFGFNDPIVNEFKKRYGIDIRKQHFTRAASRTDWVQLRGEYLTDFYRELKAAMKKNNQPLGVMLDPHDLHYTQPWNVEEIIQTAGPVYQDLETWVRDGIVDEFGVFGSSSSRLQAKATEDMLWMTRGTPAGVAVFTSGTPANWKKLTDKGVNLINNYNEEEMFLDRGGLPDEPLASLKSKEDLRCMKVLSQIIYGKTTGASISDLIPLTKHANLLIRRMAYKALGLTKDPKVVPVLEKGLEDKENPVRCIAAFALGYVQGPESCKKILATVDKYGNHMFNELVVLTLRKFDMAAARPLLVNAIRTSKNYMVRTVALRTLEKFSTETEIPLLVQTMEDEHQFARYIAPLNLGFIMNNTKAVEALTAATRHRDPVVSNRAAASLELVLKRKEPAITSLRPQILEALKALYAQMGDRSTRSDTAWGYRPAGNALLAAGPEGEKILQDFMNQTTDRKLAESAWKSLYIRQKPFSFSEVTSKENDAAFKMRPKWLDQPAPPGGTK